MDFAYLDFADKEQDILDVGDRGCSLGNELTFIYIIFSSDERYRADDRSLDWTDSKDNEM